MKKKMYEFLKSAGTFYISTIDKGVPRVRPFGFVMLYKERIYFCTNNQKDVYRQLQENPSIEICACAGDEWIRISGKVTFDDDMEAKKAVFIEDPGMNTLYKPEDDIFEVFYMEHGEVTKCSLSGESERGSF